jgi:hypothetical protein
MKTNIKVTNHALYNEKVIEVDTTGLTGQRGTLSVEVEGEGWHDYTGEHGLNDYEQDFGFVLGVEV